MVQLLGSTPVPCKLMLLGSPTYGTGDWHHLWEKWSTKLAECRTDWSKQRVALFALGDATHHSESFAGAILHLRDFASRLGVIVIGETPIDETYDYVLCEPLLTNGRFPGLVLDQVKQRRLGSERIRKWVEQLKREMEECLGHSNVATDSEVNPKKERSRSDGST